MKGTKLFGLMAALSPALALADMSYDSFDVSYVDVEIDDANVDGDGFEVAGSYGLNSKVFLFGAWQDQDLDFGINGREIEVGAGLHHPLSSTLDFVGTVSYVDADLDAGNFSADDDAFAISGGIRTQLTPSFQLDASLRYVDYDRAGSDTGVLVGGRWYFADNMAISFGTDLEDNADALRVGFRMEF